MTSSDWRTPRPPTLQLLPDGTPPLDHGDRLPDPTPLPGKPPADWRTVPVPRIMRDVPRDNRGFPVPYHLRPVGFTEGDPADLRVLNGQALYLCLVERRCGICGRRLNHRLVFSGGPFCVMNRVFTEPPLHEECARYAMHVCPFLVYRDFTHHRRKGDAENCLVIADDSGDVHIEKGDQERTCLYFTDDYLVVPRKGKIPLVITKDARSVEWYKMDGTYLCRTRPTGYAQ